MSAALISLALQAGAPLVRDILSQRIGAQNAELAEGVVGLIARRAGVSVGELPEIAKSNPDSVIDAIADVEVQHAPGMVALYAQEVEFAQATLQADQNGAPWTSAWRPAGMYLIGFLWLWNVVILHVVNAIAKIALPPVPFEQLLQLSGLYFGLYMGGHTVKDVITKWAARAPVKEGRL
ncbi:hypothetical protein [Thalassovita sp.]|uniref:hypothetical protein n=1 Tax=Thalassovita sp. TaxID=1979401 RepID=UPI002B26C6F7|nr:hypothetical protein [Thalassovita sp.]